MPDPTRLITTIRRAIDFTKSTPGRKGRVVDSQEIDDVLVAGDLHGNLASFQAIYKAADLGKNPRRHLVFQEVIHSTFRYPMGGDKSHQLLDLFSALKCQHPRQVHLLMGNHEMSQWTNRRVLKNDEDYNEIFEAGIEQAYADKAKEIYASYLELFSVLPLAIRLPNRVLLSHSVPTAKYLPTFDFAKLEQENPPSDIYNPGGIAYGLVWGRDTSQAHVEAFLKQVGFDWLITGHIPCEQGFDFPNDRQLILDSAYSPAAYALIPANREITREEFLACVRRI